MMPETREDVSEDSHPTESSWRIITLWRKIHFSGRVIMCSVLLGLGLILIGALVFVINIDDENVNKTKSDGTPDVPNSKAPSNYSGPVVMGIGTFIVTVGVIMCLFETQVCRKKTADSKPLIPESADSAEKKVSDPASVSPTSHGHKIHRHGARKASSSPRKHKSRHARSHPKEKNLQKSPSPKSPPVSIETPRYLTSSGENFLTPPNTLDEHTSSEKARDSRNADDKNASLMKSFTSSGPSWNQSAEFLTPSTSFRDASLSLNNSVEIDPSQCESNISTELAEKQFTSSEYFTPLTVEEDRIQQLLIRVKSEQKQATDAIQPAETPDNLESDSNLSSSFIQEETGKDSDGIERAENESSVNHEIQPTVHCDSVISKENKLESLKTEDACKLDKDKSEISIPVTNDGSVISETINNTLNENSTVSEAKILPSPTTQQEVFQNDSHSDLKKPSDHDQRSLLDEEAVNFSEEIKEPQNDFDSSVSSNETVVSPDSFQENPTKTNITAEKELSSTLQEDLTNNETNSLCSPEFTNNDATHQNKDSVDLIHAQQNTTASSENVEATEPNTAVNETVETLNVNEDVLSKVTESVSKDESS